MSDHLTNARTCVTHASKARDAGSAISWLTDACKQIIAYLESQQAPPAAQQGGAAMSTYTPTTATIRAEYAGRVEAWEMTYAEQEAARAEEVVEFDRWLAAHDAQVAAQALREAVASLRAKFGPTNRAADYLTRAEQIKEDR